MLTLYYCPRACSMASHVALEEAGATFAAKKVDIFIGEHRTPEYLAVNPRGKVPALRFDDGRVLVESTAILSWIGTAFPDAGLLGADQLDRARTQATCAWLSSSVHPAFSRFVHPDRFSDDNATYAALKSCAKESFWVGLREIDRMLADGPWIMGDRFTVADPYALALQLRFSAEMCLPSLRLVGTSPAGPRDDPCRFNLLEGKPHNDAPDLLH